ncbi:MAG: hypothetical protein RSE41_04415 [Clostridia bacterium]
MLQNFGYRISFDLKTTGYLSNDNINNLNRTIQITPSYYYISKDGNTYKDNIKLYYKNKLGKYVLLNNNYSIYFKPNDGYRNIGNMEMTSDTTYLSDKLQKLTVGGVFTLKNNMLTTGNYGFLQSWYGEYKLPNSTIAVENNSNINNNLKDGYIGVIFDIQSIDKENSSVRKLYYNKNDTSLGQDKINTTQWDYEGFLGFNDPGNTANNIRLQLEKGMWNIDNDMYNKIKSTVILYDIDNRAASDFE